MEKQRDSRIIALVALIVAVIGTSVAFATLTSTLRIGSTNTAVTVDARWNVEFTSLTTSTTGTAVFTTTPIIDSNDSTKINDFAATFSTPGDSLTINFKVENNGTIDAELTTITKASTLTCTSTADPADADEAAAVCSNLTYELLDSEGVAITTTNNTLEKTTGEQAMKLVLTYAANQDVGDIPTGGVRVTGLGISLEYDQASL